ncbi:MAG: tetratricopeptide repeat protein, partial [Candidatus Dormibacteraceae bacterium]
MLIFCLCLAAIVPLSAQTSEQDLVRNGMKAVSAHDFTAAQKIFAQLVKQDPSPGNYYLLATAEASAGDLKNAVAHYERSIALGNNSATVYYNLGITQMRLHHSDQAIHDLRLTLAADPQFPQAAMALGSALIVTGKPGEAIPYLEQALKLTPKNPAVWVNLVQCQFATNQSATA